LKIRDKRPRFPAAWCGPEGSPASGPQSGPPGGSLTSRMIPAGRLGAHRWPAGFSATVRAVTGNTKWVIDARVAAAMALVAAIAALAACATSERGDDHSADADVLRYCERFAAAVPVRLLKSPEASYVVGSARVDRAPLDDAANSVANVFQPHDSRFVGVWQCAFSLSINGRHCTGEVALPIAEHAEFAQYTSWPDLAFIEENRIVSTGGTRIGYATPKYFDTSCEQQETARSN